MTTHCNKVEDFVAFNSLMKCQYSLFRPPCFFRKCDCLGVSGLPHQSERQCKPALRFSPVFQIVADRDSILLHSPNVACRQKDEGKGTRKIIDTRVLCWIVVFSDITVYRVGKLGADQLLMALHSWHVVPVCSMLHTCSALNTI